MSSRSLAAARARRAGDNAPPVSGNRPITSIGSQAAFAQPPPGMGYNMPPPPNNVRTSKTMQQPQQYNERQNTKNTLPFNKLSISDAIGLITLRLGRVEQWIIETDHEEDTKQSVTGDFSGIPSNHKVIDNSVLTTIINRLDSLEKNGTSSSSSSEEFTKLSEEVRTLTEQFKRMSDDVTKHNIELAKCSEQVFKFNRELTETKDILKSFMVKYDMFNQEITQNFSDYETALTDLEKRLPVEEENLESKEKQQEETIENNENTSVDLKNVIEQELANS
jgi:hypothetical protein